MTNNKNFLNTLVISLSALIVAFLVWYIYFKQAAVSTYTWSSYLPYVNAFLNSLSALFLLIGFCAIKNGNVKIHIKMMATATVTSGLFLVSYLLYHHFHGDTKFIGIGLVRYTYFFILISHIILSIALVPMALVTIINALCKNFETHRKWAKWTFPVWMYVSITGVLIVFFLKVLNY